MIAFVSIILRPAVNNCISVTYCIRVNCLTAICQYLHSCKLLHSCHRCSCIAASCQSLHSFQLLHSCQLPSEGVAPINTRSGRVCRQLLTMQTQSAHSGGGGAGISRKTARPQCCKKTIKNIFRGGHPPQDRKIVRKLLYTSSGGVDIHPQNRNIARELLGKPSGG